MSGFLSVDIHSLPLSPLPLVHSMYLYSFGENCPFFLLFNQIPFCNFFLVFPQILNLSFLLNIRSFLSVSSRLFINLYIVIKSPLYLLSFSVIRCISFNGEAVVQWSSALVCEPRIPGSNPRHTLTTFHSLISLLSGQRLPKLLPYYPQTGLTTFICV